MQGDRASAGIAHAGIDLVLALSSRLRAWAAAMAGSCVFAAVAFSTFFSWRAWRLPSQSLTHCGSSAELNSPGSAAFNR